MLSTKNLSANKEKVVRKRKTGEYFEEYAAYFTRKNIPEEDYLPKQVFSDRRGNLVVRLDQKELSRERDLYIEFVNSEFGIGDDRKLWKMDHNPEFETEYEKISEVYPCMYSIPVEELTEVDYKSVNLSDISSGKEDAPFTEMTIRDYVTIHKEIPVSNKPWLNALIEKHLKQ